MTDSDIVKKLTTLARMEVSEGELNELAQEIPAILKFVETVSHLPVGELKRNTANLKNVMREDGEPHEPGVYTEKMLKAAPASKEGRLVVKQVVKK